MQCLFWAFALCSLAGQQDSAAFVKVDQMPCFAGCEQLSATDPARRQCSDKALADFVATHLRYPDSAVANQIDGTVVVSFVVDENGLPGQETVLRDIGQGCGEAALAVVRAMPRWDPGQHDGKKVKVRLTLPVRFYFKVETPDEGQAYAIHWGALRGVSVSKSDLEACLDQQLYVRDAYGTAVHVSELVFRFEKKRKTSEASAAGNKPDKKMRRLAQKVSAGGTFTVSATIQREGRLVVVEKSFLIQ